MTVKFTTAETADIVGGKKTADEFNKESNQSLENAGVILKYFMAGYQKAATKSTSEK